MKGIYLTGITAVAAFALPALVAVLSYLLGCINGAIATSHIFYHDDVRRHGSGNAGLTNFYRNYGARCAPMVIAFDMLKAVGAVLLSNYFWAIFSAGALRASISVRSSASSATCFRCFTASRAARAFCAAARCCCFSTGASRSSAGARSSCCGSRRAMCRSARSPRRSACRLPRISCSITRPAQCSARAFRFLCCGRTAATSKDS